jgi:hypothetical protein
MSRVAIHAYNDITQVQAGRVYFGWSKWMRHNLLGWVGVRGCPIEGGGCPSGMEECSTGVDRLD